MVFLHQTDATAYESLYVLLLTIIFISLRPTFSCDSAVGLATTSSPQLITNSEQQQQPRCEYAAPNKEKCQCKECALQCSDMSA